MEDKITQEKKERFKKIASRRTARILDTLRKLGNCSRRGVYSYSSEDVKKIFSTIYSETQKAEKLFDPKTKPDTFTL